MFDAKSILEAMMKGAQPQPGAATAGTTTTTGGLGDMLGQILGQAGKGGTGGLGDMLGKMLNQGGQGQSAPAAQTPGAAGTTAAAGFDPANLQDMLRKAQAQLGAGGSLTEILGQVLGQATSGVADGARQIDAATGASGQIRNVTGKSPDEIIDQVKTWLQQNQTGAAAGAAGLGAVVLGTRAGRSLAGKALSVGTLALIGGLAYKALQHYQDGKPLLSSQQAHALTPAPQGSGFEPAAVDHDRAKLYIRAMIAAAAADGRVDPAEQARIVASLKQSGNADGAEDFLADELNHPATVEDLAADAKTEQEALQVYTAARLAVSTDDGQNHDFLVRLAAALGLDATLTEHVNAAALAAS